MRRSGPSALWILVAVPALLAGCADEQTPSGDDAGPALAWLEGDRWSYRLSLSDGSATDDWTVLGPAVVNGHDVVQVASTTVRQRGTSSEVGSFDARTLALRHVDGDGITLDFDPAEVWLMPPEDRSYQTQITEARPAGTRTARASYTIVHEGEDVIDTEAGVFSADRFLVRKTTFTDAGSREEVSTYWWSPAVANVVRQDVSGATVRTLTSYELVDGTRAVPGRET